MKTQPFFSRPVYLLQAEALCAFVACCGAYHMLFPHHWVMFACLLFVPDLSLLWYIRGPDVAASIAYNAAHGYALPGFLGILAVHFGSALLGEVSLIWIAHISLDRTLGYGLKYPTSFMFTHIQSAASPVIGLNAPRV